jgi:hypothetical protein
MGVVVALTFVSLFTNSFIISLKTVILGVTLVNVSLFISFESEIRISLD